jgi:hypothetical protein
VVGSGLVFQGAQPADLPRQETGSLHSDITDFSSIEQLLPWLTTDTHMEIRGHTDLNQKVVVYTVQLRTKGVFIRAQKTKEKIIVSTRRLSCSICFILRPLRDLLSSNRSEKRLSAQMF